MKEGKNVPLNDLQVLELGSMLAGPFIGTMLADFGANVIKVEKPNQPDPLREWPPHKNNQPLWWKSMARNKHLITLNISKLEGREVLKNMLKNTDIVIERSEERRVGKECRDRWRAKP